MQYKNIVLNSGPDRSLNEFLETSKNASQRRNSFYYKEKT